MPAAYNADLARIHHEGFGFVAEHAAGVLLEALQAAEIRSGTMVDLGCGSGILSKPVAAAGFEIFGVDYSTSMLDLARASVPTGAFVQGSVLDVSLPSCVAVAAVGEIFCYAFDERAGLGAFALAMQSIHRALVPGGVFLFDVAGPGRAPQPRTGFVDRGDWCIVHQSSEQGDTLTREITTFIRAADAYRRTDERHVLRLYRPQDVLAALESAGFQAALLGGYGAFTFPSGWHAFLATK